MVPFGKKNPTKLFLFQNFKLNQIELKKSIDQFGWVWFYIC
jgi:hypothetical protein